MAATTGTFSTGSTTHDLFVCSVWGPTGTSGVVNLGCFNYFQEPKEPSLRQKFFQFLSCVFLAKKKHRTIWGTRFVDDANGKMSCFCFLPFLFMTSSSHKNNPKFLKGLAKFIPLASRKKAMVNPAPVDECPSEKRVIFHCHVSYDTVNKVEHGKVNACPRLASSAIPWWK